MKTTLSQIPDGGGSASSKELVHIMHTKGRMVYDATHDSYTYEYFLKDHLGNTRVVFADNNQDGRINPDPLNGTDIRQTVEGYYPAATDGILGRCERSTILTSVL